MSDPKPTRLGVTLGSTSRNGGDFEFRKISLSLDRDLGALENPIDAYRDVKALLERMIREFQGSKPPQTGNALAKASLNTSAAKPSYNEDSKQNRPGPPGLPASKPAGLQLETIRERLQKWLPDLEIVDGFDGFSVKPKRYLDQSWGDVNEVVRALGGRWFKGAKPTDGAWRINK